MSALTSIKTEFTEMAGAVGKLYDRFNPDTDVYGDSIRNEKDKRWRSNMDTNATVWHISGTFAKAAGIIAVTGVAGSAFLTSGVALYGLGTLIQGVNRGDLEYPDSIKETKKVLGAVTKSITKQAILPF